MAAKKTLLDIVQDVLSALDGDEVNTIFETTESSQVARIVKESYEIILGNSDLREQVGLFELTPHGPSKPVLMSMPANAEGLEWLKYNRKQVDDPYPQFQELKFIPIDEFTNRMYALPQSVDSNIGTFNHTVNGSNIEVYYWSNKGPEWFTTLDDNQLLFDSYDSELETNLEDQNSLAFGRLTPAFMMTDTFIPMLDGSMVQLLVQEAKAQAFVELRQIENTKAEKRARRLWIRGQKDSNDIAGIQAYGPYDGLPNFGRTGAWKRSPWGKR